MRKKSHCLIFAAVATIIGAAAGAQVEFFPGAKPAPRIYPNPGLVGAKLMEVAIVAPDYPLGKGVFEQEKLKSRVEDLVRAGGLSVHVPREGIAPRLGEISSLRVELEILRVRDSGDHICRVQTFLSRTVNLAVRYEGSPSFRPDVWKTEPAMVVAPLAEMAARVSDVVSKQVDSFVRACPESKWGSPRTTKASDVNVGPVSGGAEDPNRPVNKSTAEYKYVASKNGEVFHRPDCASAKRILPANLVGYQSREEAIAAGKRPCTQCKP